MWLNWITLNIAGGNIKSPSHSEKAWQFLKKKTKNNYTYTYPAIVLLGIYPKEMKTYVYIKSLCS